MHYYCIYCSTARSKTVADLIERMGIGRCVTPRIVQRKWIKGKTFEETHDYLPGYVFLYTEEAVSDFQPIWNLNDVYRLLGSEEDLFELYGADRAFAQMLEEQEGTIGILKAYREGDVVKLADSAFSAFEGVITRFDRARKRAEIEFDFDGKKQRVWCGIDLLDSVQKTDSRSGETR
ncbi:MAG: hypothetical protein IJP98_06090 [Clostridia bacterium]|nr:hypothetical protein [Clostridia bacterium]